MGQRKGWAETESRSDDKAQSDDEDWVFTVGRESLVEARDKGKVEKRSLGQMRKLGQGRKQSKIPSAMMLKMIVGIWIIGRLKKDPNSSSMTRLMRIASMMDLFQVWMKLSRELRLAQVTPFQGES